MPSRTINRIQLHNFQDTWYTSDGRYEISAEGRTASTCAMPHQTRNGMMCPGLVSHVHSVWWVWDAEERMYPMGLRSFDTLPQAVGALDEFLTWRGR